MKEIERLLNTAPEDEGILYADEVDIPLNPKSGRDWMPSGIQKMVLTPGKNRKNYLAGALNARNGEPTFAESDHKDSHLFVDPLWTLVERDSPNAPHIHLILDNYSIHNYSIHATRCRCSGRTNDASFSSAVLVRRRIESNESGKTFTLTSLEITNAGQSNS